MTELLKVPQWRIRLTRVRYIKAPRVDGPRGLIELVRPLLRDRDREVVIVVCLDGQNRPIGVEEVSMGGHHACAIVPLDVFKSAILCNARAVALAHNHMSGDPTPSKEDREFARQVRARGEVLGLHLVDSIVVCPDGPTYSMHEHNELGET